MSSPIGHTLAAITIYTAKKPASFSKWQQFLWLVWLIGLALAPDLDHLWPILSPTNHAGIRITHSLVGSSGLPIITCLGLVMVGVRGNRLMYLSLQALLAGLSQITLDLLVGVTAIPLLWPFSYQLFKLPFGILPSSPLFALDNYYLYRNLGLELLILGPFGLSIYLLTNKEQSIRLWLVVSGLLISSVGGMMWGYTLAR